MTAATKRRPKAAIVPSNAIDQVSTLLQQLPEKPKASLSLRETVAKLQDQIRATLAKGYSYEEVADLLSKQGISISPATLKNYIPSSKRQSATEPTQAKTRKRRSKAQSSEEGIEPASASSADAVPASIDASVAAVTTPEAEPTDAIEGATVETGAEPDPKPPSKRGRKAAAKAQPTAPAASEAKPKQTRGRRAGAAAKPVAASTTRRRKQADA